MPVFTVRPARPADAGLILSLLTELAVFEKLSITISEADIAATSSATIPSFSAKSPMPMTFRLG